MKAKDTDANSDWCSDCECKARVLIQNHRESLRTGVYLNYHGGGHPYGRAAQIRKECDHILPETE